MKVSLETALIQLICKLPDSELIMMKRVFLMHCRSLYRAKGVKHEN